jgi:hypothetical protein
LEYGQTLREQFMRTSNFDLVSMNGPLMNHLSQCHHLKYLRLHIPYNISLHGSITIELCTLLEQKMNKASINGIVVPLERIRVTIINVIFSW